MRQRHVLYQDKTHVALLFQNYSKLQYFACNAQAACCPLCEVVLRMALAPFASSHKQFQGQSAALQSPVPMNLHEVATMLST